MRTYHKSPSQGLRDWLTPGLAFILTIQMLSATAHGQAASGSVYGWGSQPIGPDLLTTTFQAVAPGDSLHLALRMDGSLFVWGYGDYDDLLEAPTPNTGFTAIAKGNSFSMALREDGSIVAWGCNYPVGSDFGQCSVPSPNTNFAAISAGGSHALGLKLDGSIIAWGNSSQNRLNVPAPNTGFRAISAGASHSLGLKDDGSIVAWGDSCCGKLNIPAPNTGFVAVAAGDFQSLGLKADGSIVAWGCGFSQQNFGQCVVPAPNQDFVAIAAGFKHSLGLKEDGSVVAWGCRDPGDGTPQEYNGQCNVWVPNADFEIIAAHSEVSFGIKTDGSIVSWDHSSVQTNTPPSNIDLIAVACGANHSLGLRSDRSIVAWGNNVYGQTDVPTPNTNFTAVAAGRHHSLGLKSDGSVVAWGRNHHGQTDVPAPNTGFTKISAGAIHSLGLKSDGSIVAWGSNLLGQLDVPIPNGDFVAVASEFEAVHSLGLKADGSVVAWGWSTSVPNPNADFVKIAVAGTRDLGLKSDGTIVPWRGSGSIPNPNADFIDMVGNLGLKSEGSIIVLDQGLNSLMPYDIRTPNTDFVAIASGGLHHLGIRRHDACRGPVAWWEAEGDASDSVSNNDGTLLNDADFVPGICGQAFGLDGHPSAPEYVQITDADLQGIDFKPGDSYTIVFWAKRTGGTFPARIIGKRGGCTLDNRYLEVVADTSTEFAAFPLNEWVMVAQVADGPAQHQLDLIVNDIVISELPYTLPVETNGVHWRIGTSGSCLNQDFEGYIDEVVIFDRALSLAQIHHLYTHPCEPLWETDNDSDGFEDLCDNCPTSNPGQEDVGDFVVSLGSGDGIGDACDNCPNHYNPNQLNSDSDPLGDACDNCPQHDNQQQEDTDGDGVGNLCDNCPIDHNPNQEDDDEDGVGNLCDPCPQIPGAVGDTDDDGVGDACDNCFLNHNPLQENGDEDQYGDACDNCPNTTSPLQDDSDSDGLGNLCDNCPIVNNPLQEDDDADGDGNACDNCIDVANPQQQNADGDAFGDACDPCPVDPAECVDFTGGCDPPSNAWSCFDNWDLPGDDYPDNDTTNYSVVLSGTAAAVCLDLDVEIDSLSLLDGASLAITQPDPPCDETMNGRGGPDFLTFNVVAGGGMNVQGSLTVAASNHISVPNGPMTVGPNGLYALDEGASLPSSALLSVSELRVVGNACSIAPCPDGGHFELTDSMQLFTDGDLIVDGSLTDGPCEHARSGFPSARTFHTPPSLHIRQNSSVVIGGGVVISGAANVLHESSQPISVGGNFDNFSIRPECFNYLNGSLRLSGVAAQSIEVGAMDIGPVSGITDAEFGIANVTIAGGSQVTFRDSFDNDLSGQGSCSEAQYLGTLTLETSASATINNCRVYYETLQKDPTATISLIGCGELRSIANPQTPLLEPSPNFKSRFLSFEVPQSTVAQGAASETALRVRLVSLHHVVPPYTGGLSIPFTSFEGQVRWVGPPTQYVESSASQVPFYASALQCTPHYQDWSTVNLLHVTGSAVVPSSIYEVENVAASCQGIEASCSAVSEPLVVATTRWGDVEEPYNPPSPSTQPDLADVSALVNKFRNAPGAPIKARALLVGVDAFGTIDIAPDFSFIHIAGCVDAFRGMIYPHTISSCP